MIVPSQLDWAMNAFRCSPVGLFGSDSAQMFEASIDTNRSGDLRQPKAVQCSGLMKPDTHLGENARQIEVSDDQTTPLLYS